MKIAQLIETGNPGGAENMMLTLAATLRELGHEVAFILRKEGWLSERVAEEGFQVHVLPMRGRLDRSWIREVEAIVREHGIDVLHSHEYYMSYHAYLVARRTACRAVVTLHGRGYYLDNWLRRGVLKLLSARTPVVAVSDELADVYVKVIGVRRERLHVVPNGIDLATYAPDEQVRAEVRRELRCTDDHFVIGTVGSLYRVKGQDILLKALTALPESHRARIRVWIAGRGPEEEALRSLSTASGLDANVDFLGFRSDVSRILQGLDLLCMPSRSEGLPLAVLEAMASGTPVCASKVGALPELLGGSAGATFAAEDSQALAERLGMLMSAPKRLQALREAALDRVRDYDARTMAERYVALYHGALTSDS